MKSTKTVKFIVLRKFLLYGINTLYIYKLYAHTCIYYTSTYIHTHARAHTHTHTYTHTYTQIHTHIHTHTSIYMHVHTHIAVHVYITFRLLMEGGMVRVYRILRVMPQPTINIAKICFVTNYGKVRIYNFLDNNVLYHFLGVFMGHRKTSIKDAHISSKQLLR